MVAKPGAPSGIANIIKLSILDISNTFYHAMRVCSVRCRTRIVRKAGVPETPD